MTIASPNNPVWVVVICRMCEHIYEERVREKTTSVCPECNTPIEVYTDGRTAPSALFEVQGEVRADSHLRFGGHGILVMTRDWIRKHFGI